jgi:DNA-binding MarR family transcriptional regulator
MATPDSPAPDSPAPDSPAPDSPAPGDPPTEPAGERATAAVASLVRTADLATLESGRLLGRHGLSPASFQVLMALRGVSGPLSPSEIGRRLLVTRGTVTGLLDSLEKRGLVSRSGHPSDRRMVLVAATPAAASLLERLLPEHQALQRRILEPLSVQDQEALTDLLDRIQSRLLQSSGNSQRR